MIYYNNVPIEQNPESEGDIMERWNTTTMILEHCKEEIEPMSLEEVHVHKILFTIAVVFTNGNKFA